MPNFRFPLESLLAVRRNQRDVSRQQLAVIQRREVELLERRRALDAGCDHQRNTLRQLRRPGRIDASDCISAERHLHDLVTQIGRIEHERRLLAGEIEERRQAALDADMAVKGLERLSEKQRSAFETEESHMETLRQEDDWRNAR